MGRPSFARRETVLHVLAIGTGIRRGNNDDVRLFAVRQADELVMEVGGHRAAAADHQLAGVFDGLGRQTKHIGVLGPICPARKPNASAQSGPDCHRKRGRSPEAYDRGR